MIDPRTIACYLAIQAALSEHGLDLQVDYGGEFSLGLDSFSDIENALKKQRRKERDARKFEAGTVKPVTASRAKAGFPAGLNPSL